ncbi:MAG: hypothetical protein GY756_13020, partial [bacterium]|nr:hypothetical protein [bacterium]
NKESKAKIPNRYYFYNDELVRIIEGNERNILSNSEMQNYEKAIKEEKSNIEKQCKGFRID